MIISVWRNRERRWHTTSRRRWHPLRPEPSRVLQAVLPVLGATLGVLLFTAILPYLVVSGGPNGSGPTIGETVLFVTLGILLPAGLAFLFHPTLYVGERLFRSRKAVAPAGLAALGAALGLASGPLGYLLLAPIWATVGAVQVFRSPRPAV
ncbi:MAG: hypothetical protein ACE5KQ_03135 [Thermoplasmata archaeon]